MEAYVWGYLQDHNGNLCKTLLPSLVKNALKFNNISSITCGFNGSFAILGEKDGHGVLQIYNAFSNIPISIPYAPFCQSVQVIDQIYANKPTIELTVDHNIHSLSLGHDAAMFVENNGLKILDFKTLKIHEIAKNEFQSGVLGVHNVILSSSNELYTYGTKYSEELSSDETFFQFLKQASRRNSSDDHSLRYKSTLELLKEDPKIIKLKKTPSMIWASYKEIIAVENE